MKEIEKGKILNMEKLMKYGIYSLENIYNDLNSSYYIMLKEYENNIYLVYLVHSDFSDLIKNEDINHLLEKQLQFNMVDFEFFMEINVKYIRDHINGYLGNVVDNIGINLTQKYESYQNI